MKLKPGTEQGCSDVRLCIDELGLSDKQKKILWSLSDQQAKEIVRVLNEENEKKKEEQSKKEEEQSKKLEEIKKKILKLLDELRKYIYDEKWIELEGYFIEENKDGLGKDFESMSMDLDILECILKILKSLDNGILPEDIINRLAGEYEFKDEIFIFASRYVALFSKYGEKWKKATKKRDRNKRRKETLEYLKCLYKRGLE